MRSIPLREGGRRQVGRREGRDSELVGALSPVTHKGLHQDYTQTSIYFQIIHSTNHIIPQVSFAQTTAEILSTISERKTRKTIALVFEPIYIPRALNTGTCIQLGDLFYYAKNSGEVLEIMQVNGPEG